MPISRGIAAASTEPIEKIRTKGRTVVFALPGSEELRYLDFVRAFANVGGEKLDHIILRMDPRKIEVLEEFLHGTQQKLGLVERLGVAGAERHVKDFMIRHARMLGVDLDDVVVLRSMLGGSER